MTIREEQRDLFTLPEDWYLAHCNGQDYVMGKGIAKIFNEKYNLKNRLKKRYPVTKAVADPYIGAALLIDNVFTLITKRKWSDKPTYAALRECLEDMRARCRKQDIRKLAMPKIGCGLDGLNWDKVRAMVEEVFADTDIEILVCYL